MQQALTILIVTLCALLLARRIVRGLRRKDCGCGGGKDCRSAGGCEGCGLKENCTAPEKRRDRALGQDLPANASAGRKGRSQNAGKAP